MHKNKNVKGFGTYGDIMIRDRKMYVVPTPFGLTAGIAHTYTLVLPDGFPISSEFEQVGTLVRRESQDLIVSYQFDLRDNNLITQTVPNSLAGREHIFQAWRLRGSPGEAVTMKQMDAKEIRQLEQESGGDE